MERAIFLNLNKFGNTEQPNIGSFLRKKNMNKMLECSGQDKYSRASLRKISIWEICSKKILAFTSKIINLLYNAYNKTDLTG